MEIWRKYGNSTSIYIPMITANSGSFITSGGWAPASGDVMVSKDGAAGANITTLPSQQIMGRGVMWNFALASAELQAAKVIVTIVDAATKAVEDNGFLIVTYGHASAEFIPDFKDGVRMALTALPNAVFANSGGLFGVGSGGNGYFTQPASFMIMASVSSMFPPVLSVLSPVAVNSLYPQVSVMSLSPQVSVMSISPQVSVMSITPRVAVMSLFAPALDVHVGSISSAVKFLDVQVGSLGANVINAAAINSNAANKIADHTWRRTYANIRASSDGDTVAFRSGLGAQSKLVNKWAINGTQLTTYHEDDSTSFATQTVGSTSGAEPVTSIDTD